MSLWLGSPWALSAGEDGLVAELGIFEEGGDGVETEAGYAAVEPETHGVEHGLFDGGVAPVEVGLLLVELVVVELVDGRGPTPRRSRRRGRPSCWAGRPGLRARWGLWRLRVAAGLPSLQTYQSCLGLVRELADSMNHWCLSEVWLSTMSRMMRMCALAGFGDEAVEVGEGAVLGVDGFVVGDVVAEVDLRGGVHGGDPDGVDAEGLEVVEALGDAVEVADAVAVGVLEAAGVDLVDDGVLPPGGVDGWGGDLGGEDGGGEGGG